MNAKWALMSAIAVGSISFAVPNVPAYAADRDTVAKTKTTERIVEHRTKMEEAPPEVRKSIEDASGKHMENVQGFTRVSRGKQEYYRAVVKNKDKTEVVRIGRNGKVLGRDDDRDFSTQQVRWDDCPAPAQRLFNDERGEGANRGDIRKITRVERNGHIYFVADIEDHDGMRVVRCDEAGHRYEDDLDSRYLGDEVVVVDPEARFFEGIEGDRSSMAYNDLPRDVQRTLDRLRDHRELAHIHKIIMPNRTVRYMAVIANGDRDRRVIVDDRGGVVEDRVLVAVDEGPELRYNDLPDRVQKAFDSLRNHEEIAHIRKLEDREHGVRYQGIIVENGRDRRVVIDADGKVLEDVRAPR